MDKRKLIGTIIGVVMFALLVVGATYAWYTFGANITNGSYTAGTEEFVITYTGGTAITSIEPVSAPTNTNVTVKTKVSAYKTTNSATGTLYIKLHSTSTDILTTSGIIKYAVCSGTAANSNCTGALTNGQTGVLKTGTISNATINESTRDTELYSVAVPSTQTYYYIYMWLDGNMLDASYNGKTYSGYIHASATQN